MRRAWRGKRRLGPACTVVLALALATPAAVAAPAPPAPVAPPPVAPAPATGSDDPVAWMIGYHRHPDPDRVVATLHALKAKDELADAYGSAHVIGFLAGLFAANPGRIDGWLADLSSYAPAEQMVLIQAVWFSDTPQGRDFLARVGRPALEKIGRPDLIAGAPGAVTGPLRDPLIVEFVVGRFWATGRAADIDILIDALGRESDLRAGMAQQVAMAAALHLTWNAEQDPEVLRLCQAALARPGAAPILADIVRIAAAKGEPEEITEIAIARTPGLRRQ